MKQLNDKDFDRYRKSTSSNNEPVREKRSHEQNEDLGRYLASKLGATEIKPYFAVAYTGIPRDCIEKHLATALELGDSPPKLFMHLIKQEPLWSVYRQGKEARRENG